MRVPSCNTCNLTDLLSDEILLCVYVCVCMEEMCSKYPPLRSELYYKLQGICMSLSSYGIYIVQHRAFSIYFKTQSIIE